MLKYFFILFFSFVFYSSTSSAEITLITNGSNFAAKSVTAVSADSTLDESESIDLAPYTQATVQVVWAAHSDTSTFNLETSIDDVNWDTISGTNKTTSGTSGSTTIHLSSVPGRKIKLVITDADANAASTLTPYIMMRK